MVEEKKLRRLIGWLGMLLPWIVSIMALIYGYKFPSSISATYYIPNCIVPFMIILGSAGLLLLCYKGYDLQDKIICSIAGILGIGICLFPCDIYSKSVIVGTFGIPSNISEIIHSICAIGFFGLLAYNSLFLFTKTDGNMTDEKKKRNIIFRVCGIGMIIAFALMIPFNLCHVRIGIWISETIALTFFGVSWLTKAQAYSILFKDKTDKEIDDKMED